jgi:hypothetical protein
MQGGGVLTSYRKENNVNTFNFSVAILVRKSLLEWLII